MKKQMHVVAFLVISSLILAACGTSTPVATEAPTEAPPTAPPFTATPDWTAPVANALVSYPADLAPVLDGKTDDPAWSGAAELIIPVANGFNDYATQVSMKSVYEGDTVYFLVVYADPTESWFRSPWQKQEDGTWIQLKDPNDTGGDNNLYYEDKFAMIWSVNNSIKKFETLGCYVACHAGENADLKPFGNKYTGSEGELGDIWHWKSVRNDGQIDDQYLDWTRFDPEAAKEAGRKSDHKDSGGYADNFATLPDPSDSTKTVPDKTRPGFTSPNIDLTTGAPGYILDSEKVALDQAALDAMPAGSTIPGIIKSPIVGDRGDITAAWFWENGYWTIEFSRKLTTGSETDVQFSDLTAIYYFGMAIFENAQVRHAYEEGSTPFVFKPE